MTTRKQNIGIVLCLVSLIFLNTVAGQSDFEKRLENEMRDYLKFNTALSDDEIEKLIALQPPKQPLSCPSAPDFKSALVYALKDYYRHPSKSKFTRDEVKDMIVFYLSQDLSTADCFSSGDYSGKSISSILIKTSSCEDMCELIRDYYYQMCDLRYELCTREGHPSGICDKLKEICYEVAELEYELCMMDCGVVTTTTTTPVTTTTSTIVPITTTIPVTTTTIPAGCHNHTNPPWVTDGNYKIKIIDLGCRQKGCAEGGGDSQEALIEIREGHHCGEQFWVWVDLEMTPNMPDIGSCYEAEIFTTMYGAKCGHVIRYLFNRIDPCPTCCHTHEDPTWLTTNDYNILVVEKGCTSACGSEYLIEIRERDHPHCGERLWVWLKAGLEMDIDRCYRVVIDTAASPCGYTINRMGNEIQCPTCPTTTTTTIPVSTTTTSTTSTTTSTITTTTLGTTTTITTIPGTTTTTTTTTIPPCGDFDNCHDCVNNDCEWCERFMYSHCTKNCDAFNCFLGGCIVDLSNCPGTTTTTTIPVSTTTTTIPSTTTTIPAKETSCTDGIDNDGDGCVDYDDVDCNYNNLVDKDGDGYYSDSSKLAGWQTATCSGTYNYVCPAGSERTTCNQDGIGTHCTDCSYCIMSYVECTGTDCDDSNPDIHPGAEEICGDGIDQDCDGIDKPCNCWVCSVRNLDCPDSVTLGSSFKISYEFYGTGGPVCSYPYEVRTIERDGTQEWCDYTSDFKECEWHKEERTLVAPSTPGTYTYTVKCYGAPNKLSSFCGVSMDPRSSKSCSVTVSEEKPDLIVTDISWTPANPKIGDEICISATIKNIGTKAVDGSTLTAWTYINGYHAANTFYGKKIGVGDTLTKKILCSKYGENVWFRKGKNIVTVEIDPKDVNIIDESNESNNERTETLTITEEKPDLIVTDIYWTPANPTADYTDVVRIYVKVKNIGDVDANDFKINLNTNGYNTWSTSMSLGAGKEISRFMVGYKIGPHQGLHVGNNTLKAKVDCDDTVDESNEDNNERTETLTITEEGEQTCTDSDGGVNYYKKGEVIDKYGKKYTDYCIGDYIREYYCTPSNISAYLDLYCSLGCGNGACIKEEVKKQPDLIVTDISWTPANPKIGDEIKFKVTVKNIGTISVPSPPTLVKIPSIGYGPGSGGGSGSIAPGDSLIYDFSSYPAKIDSPGDYEVISIVDYADSVDESNESNNERTETITVSAATCTDSDGGVNYYKKGEVIDKYGRKYTDYCYENYLREYYCTPYGVALLKLYYCSHGCSNGACVNQTTTCTDSDGGVNYYKKGEVIDKYGRKYTDYCYENYLREYYCTPYGVALLKLYYCSHGCSNGACVKKGTEKSCSLSGYSWTDTRASVTACNNYCKDLGYSGGSVIASGSKSCAGATCSYISDFSTCKQDEVHNDGHCGCNSRFTCRCG